MECYPNTPKLWLQYGKRYIFGWMQRAACLSPAKLAMLQPPRLYLRSGPGKWGSDWFLEVGEYGQWEKWCPNGLQALFYNFCMPVRPRFLNQQDLSIDHITVSETLKARLPQASSHLSGSSASCTRKQSIKLPKLRNLDESLWPPRTGIGQGLCKPPKCHSIHSKKEKFSRSSVGVTQKNTPWTVQMTSSYFVVSIFPSFQGGFDPSTNLSFPTLQALPGLTQTLLSTFLSGGESCSANHTIQRHVNVCGDWSGDWIYYKKPETKL